ncbi:MAG: hypothetical protein CMI94_02840 [Pelagibacteraceae bacterium]|nr:hypothetical protein [Pelagibacteraceae bacterium]|tara:strand:+ start:286 stop:684 length:399 start_codon:yes stop_codon:yes gene_type:complete
MKKKYEILIPASSGELIDKITILKIKKKKISNKTKLKNINNELNLLNDIYKKSFGKGKKIILYEEQLLNINKKLWVIEDKIRFEESKKNFGKEFVDLARQVYLNNDERSKIKKKINKLTGSHIVEEKSYKSY